MKPKSVIVVVDVSVISMLRYTKCFITICSKNLLSIYCQDEESLDVKKITNLNEEETKKAIEAILSRNCKDVEMVANKRKSDNSLLEGSRKERRLNDDLLGKEDDLFGSLVFDDDDFNW